MLNRSEILRTAWVDYRRDAKNGWGPKRGGPFDRQHFAYCLRMAWAVGKERAAKAAKTAPVARPAKVLAPIVAARVDAIRSELHDMKMGSFIPWTRHAELSAELSRIAA